MREGARALEPPLKTDIRNMRVLQIAPQICWPLDTGARLRNYHLARVLAASAKVSLLAFAEAEQTSAEMENIYERVITVPREKAYSFGKVLRGVLGSTPLPLLNYTTEEMKQALARLLEENVFDIVQMESVHLMNYLPAIRAARQPPLIVCDWHNIESDLMQQYSERERNSARRMYARKTARLMKAAERQALANFDGHIVVSDADAQRLRAINANARILVIENGVDAAHFADGKSSTKNRVLFVGSMDYHANIEGAIDFANTVWPSVRSQKPKLVFTIVGRNPTSAVRQLSSINGIEVTGSVDDVRPYYSEAIAAVVPLNVGGGSRLKILEAMAASVPVVSTVRGAEGLAVKHDENILLVDRLEQFTDAIIKVADDKQLREQLIAGGRKLVAERYDWSKAAAPLFNHYQEMLSRAEQSNQR